MKDLMQKVVSFITFDFALDGSCLSKQFTATQASQQKNVPYWSTTSTRQKIISRYWFELVLSHFIFLFGFPVALMQIFSPDKGLALPVLFLTGIITFTVLLLFNYWPNYYSNFLPKLETI